MQPSTLLRFLPPVALMVLIFLLSAQSDLSTGLGVWDLILRKLGHAGIYGALTLLWFYALRPFTGRDLLFAAVISLLYAVSDEFHQSFVGGRYGSPVDVGIDAVGIGAAVLLTRWKRFRWTAAGQ